MSDALTMNEILPVDLLGADTRADLEVVLEAWQQATSRLEQTHEALQGEVRRLTDELEIKNRELARKNRLADLGQMAAHVAHEVRNNLVPVTLYLSLLRRRLSEDNAAIDIFNKITAGCTALDATVNDLLHFTADRDPNCTSVAVGPLVNDVLTALAPQLSAQKILVDTEIASNLSVFADQEMLRRVVLNLTLNALDAMPGGGELTVSSDCDENGWEITVADTGPGLSDDVLKRAFEPFFTTKNNGTGLGLAIVYRIAEVHGGQIVAANHSSGGAAFTFRIPQTAPTQSAQPDASGQRMAA